MTVGTGTCITHNRLGAFAHGNFSCCQVFCRLLELHAELLAMKEPLQAAVSGRTGHNVRFRLHSPF